MFGSQMIQIFVFHFNTNGSGFFIFEFFLKSRLNYVNTALFFWELCYKVSDRRHLNYRELSKILRTNEIEFHEIVWTQLPQNTKEKIRQKFSLKMILELKLSSCKLNLFYQKKQSKKFQDP